MIKIEILSDLHGAPLGRTEHCEPTRQAAQQWAAHWAREMVEGGFIPEGAVVTYVLTEDTIGDAIPMVIDVISYLHASEESDATASGSDEDITTQ